MSGLTTEIIITMIGDYLGRHKTSFTIEELNEGVDWALNTFKGQLDLDRESLLIQVRINYSERQEESIGLSDDYVPWLKDKLVELNFKSGFWGRYSQYLSREEDFSPIVVNRIDKLTDDILDHLFDPNVQGSIDKKGLVVGNVQSGKTANYTGLIAKAADAGFKIIIVLAGMHNNLRSQTQIRIDKHILGFDTGGIDSKGKIDSQRGTAIGVGLHSNQIVAHSLTTVKQDFSKNAANGQGINFETKEPIIAVIKKNTSILKSFNQWLFSKTKSTDQKIYSKSILIIDDEADNASINTAKDPEKLSRINEGITQIIDLFPKSAYVGYTATPFANIFIPPDDFNLFPKNFIKSIPPPSLYVGAEKIFGFEYSDDEDNTNLPIVNVIDDYLDFVPDRHKKDDSKPTGLPESLKTAIRCFILNCAIRALRGQAQEKNKHNSMLIHVSRWVSWNEEIKDLVDTLYYFYRNGIDQNDVKILNLFRETFEKDSENYDSYATVSEKILSSDKFRELDHKTQVHSWKDILPHLNKAVQKIEVRSIYGKSKSALDYKENEENGLFVIAVGADKLSRGLTLEGLSVSYYLRASRMYDTLMQMGRWFGYRKGYVDLCRVFTSRELHRWFSHITKSAFELNEEFEYMSNAGKTPKDYALKVQTHPGLLQITATNKMRNVRTVTVSWTSRLVESYLLSKKKEDIATNFNNVKNFISSISKDFFRPFKYGRNSFLWKDISSDEVISFLQGINALDEERKAHPDRLIQFIKAQNKHFELTNWRVVLVSNSAKDCRSSGFKINGEEYFIGHRVRTETHQSDNELYFARKNRILSPTDELIDLSEEELNRVEVLTQEYINKANVKLKFKGKKLKSISNGSRIKIARESLRDPKNPVLILTLIDAKESFTLFPIENHEIPLVGYGVSFPRSNFNVPISYAVNSELIELYNYDDVDEGDE